MGSIHVEIKLKYFLGQEVVQRPKEFVFRFESVPPPDESQCSVSHSHHRVPGRVCSYYRINSRFNLARSQAGMDKHRSAELLCHVWPQIVKCLSLRCSPSNPWIKLADRSHMWTEQQRELSRRKMDTNREKQMRFWQSTSSSSSLCLSLMAFSPLGPICHPSTLSWLSQLQWITISCKQ